MTADPLPEARHITVGYGHETYGDIWLDDQDQIQASGKESALLQLWESVNRQPFYRGLTAPQILARMTAKMRGPMWAAEVKTHGRQQQPQ